MSLTSQVGALAVAKQTQRDGGVGTYVADTLSDYIWFPTLRIPQFATRNADQLPPEIGGQRGSFGSYVVNVAVEGTVEMLGRGLSLCPLLHSLMGTEVTAEAISGVSTYIYTISETYQWLGIIKKVSTFYAERYDDCLVDSLTVTMNNGQPARLAFDILGCNSTRIEVPTSEQTSAYWDRINPLQVVGPLASISFGHLTGDEAATFKMPVRSGEVRIGNGSSRDEYVIGSFYRYDITKSDLILEMTAEVIVTNVELYNTVYYGAETIDFTPETGNAEMSPTLTECDHFQVMCSGAVNIGGDPDTHVGIGVGAQAVKNSLTIEFATVQLVTFPFELVGNNLLVSSVMIRGHLQTDESSPVTVTLVCPNALHSP